MQWESSSTKREPTAVTAAWFIVQYSHIHLFLWNMLLKENLTKIKHFQRADLKYLKENAAWETETPWCFVNFSLD